MKKIWKYLRIHLTEDFHLKHYILIALLLASFLLFNYTFDFADTYLEGLKGFRKIGAYFIFYSSIYYSTLYSYIHFYKQKKIPKNKMFWVKSIFGIFILSLDSSVPFLYPLIEKTFDPKLQLWSYKVAVNMVSFITVFTPIVIFYFLYDQNQNHLYGLKPKQFDAKPYVGMLLIMLPIIVLVSFHGSFQRQYPMYQNTNAHEFLGTGEWFTVATYEIAYAMDFVTVELLFRGFMVLGLATFLKRGAVLSMAALYCALHFGKPVGEAISSIFGGYLLGVIAYETKSIWGGVIVHIGIAWMMELVAFLQK